MKKFDLESAKRGEPICFRNGAKARFIVYDEKTKKIIYAYNNGSGIEGIGAKSIDSNTRNNSDDIVMYEPIRKQFDYDEYIKNPGGWRLETRNGCNVEYIGQSNKLDRYCQVFYAVAVDLHWEDACCAKNGVFMEFEQNDFDLFMIEVTP